MALPKKTVDVLGVKYSVYELSKKEDKFLENADGYCDKTTKKIVITTKGDDNQLEDFEVYRKGILRHELLHAFLFESGLHENMTHPQYGHDEEMIDWFAKLYPRISKAYKDLGVSD